MRLARLVEQLLMLSLEIHLKEPRQQQLVEQQAINQQRLDSVIEGVVACDAQANLTLFNNTARHWHGGNIMALEPEQSASHYHLCDTDGSTALTLEQIPLLRALRGEAVRDASMCIRAVGQRRYRTGSEHYPRTHTAHGR